MADPDLESLKQEVDFSTPLREASAEDSSGYHSSIDFEGDEDDNFNIGTTKDIKQVSIKSTGVKDKFKVGKGDLNEFMLGGTNLSEGDNKEAGTSNIVRETKKY